MRPSSTTFFSPLILLLLLLLLLSVQYEGAAAEDRDNASWLIPGACGLVAVFDGRVTQSYCVSTLKSAKFDPKMKSSLHGLAWISMNLLKDNVTTTKVEIKRMVAANGGKMGRFVKEGLVHCVSMYDEAVDRVTEGLKLFEEKKYGDADLKVVMIQSDGYECEAWFTQDPGVASPLTKQNKDSLWLSAMTALLIRTFDSTYTPWGN
ncbi:hypothetical protein Dimus_024489 [Dionaea muscipula]